MQNCNKCDISLPDDAIFCTFCGTDQRYNHLKQNSDTFLNIICYLTIAGVAISLLYWLIEAIFLKKDSTTFQIIFGLLIISGKFTGAILMLQKKLMGLYIYTVAASIAIISQLVAPFIYLDEDMTIQAYLSSGILMSVLFSVVFLSLYWLNVNRRLLS